MHLKRSVRSSKARTRIESLREYSQVKSVKIEIKAADLVNYSAKHDTLLTDDPKIAWKADQGV